MGKKARKSYRNISIVDDDDFDDLFDDEFDADDLSRESYSTSFGGGDGKDRGLNARRRIERRRDMKQLYSQLDEWEEFGSNHDNYIY